MPDDEPVATVEIEDRTDRWRFRCPNGHTTWEPTNHHFWCRTCARMDSSDGVFEQLRDVRDDRLIARERVQLLDRVGPYDKDLDRRNEA
jgi:hypothetical protein